MCFVQPKFSQVMVMIDLMIVRLDKKNWSGPVGDINVIDGTMDNPLDYGLWMGHGDFLGTVGTCLMNQL